MIINWEKRNLPWTWWILRLSASTPEFSCPLLHGWISVMSIGNITGGQTSYPRRDCTWRRAISYLLNHLGTRLLGLTHHSSFRICSFYYSWSHMIHWDTIRFCWASYYRIQESLSLLGSDFWAPVIFSRDIDDYFRQLFHERDLIVVVPRCFGYLCKFCGYLFFYLFCDFCMIG